MQAIRPAFHRAFTLVLALLLALTLLPLETLAVSGNEVAADGVYTSTVMAQKYKKGKLDETYYGRLSVYVTDGEIAGLYVSGSDKISNLITNEIYWSYVGQPATVDAVQGVDAVSSASVADATSSATQSKYGGSSAKKYYVSDLKQAIINALSGAPAAVPGPTAVPVAETYYTGYAAVGDGEGSAVTIKVGVSDGKIASIIVDNDSSVGNWDSLVSKNAPSYVGLTADEVDGVSAATKYSAAVRSAVSNALAGDSAQPSPEPTQSPAPSETPAPADPSVPAHAKSLDTADGYRLTLDVTAQDSVTSESGGQVVTKEHANIVLLLDLTSSMTQSFGGTTRIEALRTAAASFVEALPAQDADSKVNIITYWDDNYRFQSAATGWTSLNADGKETLLETCGALEAAYTTNYATDQRSALAAAGNALNEVFSNGNASYVLLFTDGEPSGGSSYYSTLEIAQGAVNNAKNLKALGVTVYAVGILDSANTSAPMSSSMKMTYDSLYGAFSGVDVMMNGISSNYPEAIAGSVQSDSSIGMFGGQSVTVAMGDGGNDGYYLLGSNAGELNEKFKSIGETITEEITTTTAVPMSGVVISDTLSDYVALDGAFDPVVTADGKTLVKDQDYTASVSGKTVSVAFAGALTDGTTYAVSFPVVPNEGLANGTYPTNSGATLSYQYGDAAAETVPYAESPTFTLERFYTVTWKDEDGTVLEKDENVAYGETPSYDGAEPTKAATAQYSYTFDKWTPEIGAVTGDVIYTATFTQTPVPQKVTLTYVSNGGTEYAPETYTAGEVVALDKTPFRVSHSFTGWYADEALTQPVTSVTMNGDQTVYAGWKATEVPPELNGADHFAYVAGYEDGTVRPENPITRAEVAMIFYRLLTDDVRAQYQTTDNAFADVSAGAWYNTAVSTMSAMGILNGRAADTFAPNEPITRAEFATICARFDHSEIAADAHFSDVETHWAKDFIARAASLGWIQGRSADVFDPVAKITRAEAMTLINRVLRRLPESADSLLEDMRTWPDNPSDRWYYLAVQEATNSHTAVQEDAGETWEKLIPDPDWSKYN